MEKVNKLTVAVKRNQKWKMKWKSKGPTCVATHRPTHTPCITSSTSAGSVCSVFTSQNFSYKSTALMATNSPALDHLNELSGSPTEYNQMQP